MTVTYTITRADLKAKRYKQAKVQSSGSKPRSRDTEQLARILNKVVNQ